MSDPEPSTEEQADSLDELRQRLSDLEAENEQLREQNEELKETIVQLTARLKQYENPHTPPSKRRDSSGNADSSEDDDDESDNEDSSARTDGGTVGRNPGHEATWREFPEIDDIVNATMDCCPECGDQLGDPVDILPRIIEEIPEPPPIETIQYNLHEYDCSGCGSAVRADHPNCPEEGQFGVNVLAQAAYARYMCRLPYRKIADRFEDLMDLELSGAAAWHSVERMGQAGREEYEEIRDRIRDADVVHVDETGMSIDGEQGWIWTFKTPEETLYVIRESRGSAVPEEVLGEDFEGTLVNDGWSAYPAFTDTFQRCWAHLLREADDLTERHAEADEIADRLHRLFDGLTALTETDLPPERRTEIRDRAHARLEAIIAMEVEQPEVRDFLAKIEGGLGHWLVFVTDPNVKPTNNAAENALREPVVIRKIIGALRTDSGVFTHETLLSLLATWEQRGVNPYEELQRTARGWST